MATPHGDRDLRKHDRVVHPIADADSTRSRRQGRYSTLRADWDGLLDELMHWGAPTSAATLKRGGAVMAWRRPCARDPARTACWGRHLELVTTPGRRVSAFDDERSRSASRSPCIVETVVARGGSLEQLVLRRPLPAWRDGESMSPLHFFNSPVEAHASHRGRGVVEADPRQRSNPTRARRWVVRVAPARTPTSRCSVDRGASSCARCTLRFDRDGRAHRCRAPCGARRETTGPELRCRADQT